MNLTWPRLTSTPIPVVIAKKNEILKKKNTTKDCFSDSMEAVLCQDVCVSPLTYAILSTNSLTAGFELGRAAFSVEGMSRRGLKKLLMPSCTDLCWKLSGRPPPAVPPPALPPSEGSSDPPQWAGDSSGQHLNIWRQGERMRVDSAREV